MSDNEERKPAKSEKSSSPASQDQTNVHSYPDWAAMQAYYGPRVALPQYYNSALASGHNAHPYMWGPPQPLMPPYGTPYAVYPHGGVYAHPALPIGAHPPGPGVQPSAAAATPPSVETPTKSPGKTEKGLMKKLKGFDGLAMSISNVNGNTDGGEGREKRLSPSEETEGSSDGSEGNTAGAMKRSRDSTPTIGDVNGSSGVSGKPTGPVVSPPMATGLELRNGVLSGAAKTSPTSVPHTCAVLPSEAWIQHEREFKREKRKQSNRESARRSRLRKQADTEELALKVESLIAENATLKSKINQFAEGSDKLRLENASLMEKLKNSSVGHTEGSTLSSNMDEQRALSTVNLLSRVSNSSSAERSTGEEVEPYERNSKAGTKLHQLLDTRADPVPAS